MEPHAVQHPEARSCGHIEERVRRGRAGRGGDWPGCERPYPGRCRRRPQSRRGCAQDCAPSHRQCRGRHWRRLPGGRLRRRQRAGADSAPGHTHSGAADCGPGEASLASSRDRLPLMFHRPALRSQGLRAPEQRGIELGPCLWGSLPRLPTKVRAHPQGREGGVALALALDYGRVPPGAPLLAHAPADWALAAHELAHTGVVSSAGFSSEMV
mmetsp:Transcript_627/g.1451  ORF Transcript_627/g.1451 Transcript_627/m.1451 type:complete len:212 (+) Transcript_627:193-828(+)